MNPLQFRYLLVRVGILSIPFANAAIAYTVCTILRVPDEQKTKITLIVLVVSLLIVLIVMLFKWLRKRSKAGKLEEGLAVGRAERKGEIDALRKGWKESVQKLKGTAVAGGGGRALAGLPWYVIIGAPASGKSTLLRQSGIDFPVGDAAIRGLQGTRNCDWWFSNVGIFLDTAGRYISDESAEEWGQFLELVRKHRTGSPINGVIVALPATDLFERSYDEQDLEARRIRARLDELIDHLGVNFPVWIVLTKVDLVGGFAEFFGRADAVVRQQMMGWTLEQGEGARFDSSDFVRRFEAMVHRLREIRPSMVGAADLRDRPAAFAFPDELAAAEEPLQRMLARIFEPNVYQETPLLRGVYVTSATQMGTPLQRAAARVRELLGAPAVDADAKGALIKNAYFVKDLMHERIVLDQHMTWTTEREVDRGRTKRLGINLIGASAGVLFFLTVMAFGFQASKELGKVEENVKTVSSERGGTVTKADALWFAHRQANADNLRNLGLSQQGSLRDDLKTRQREVYREDVLAPMIEGFRKDISDADVSKGLVEVGAVHAQFKDVEEALQRAADPTTKPEKVDEDEEEEEDPAAGKGDPAAVASGKATATALAGKEPDPDHAPKGFFTKKQRKTFEDRVERLRADKILGKKKKDERPTEVLLDVIWRNKLGMDEIKADIQKVHDAFAAKVRQYVRDASAAVKTIEGDDTKRAQYVTNRRNGFIAACKQVLQGFQGGSVEQEDLSDAIQRLTDAARGGTSQSGGSTADPTQDALIRSISASLVVIDASGVPQGSLEGLETLRQWNSRGTTGTPGKSDSDAEQKSALNAVEDELRKLGEVAARSELVPRPWAGDAAPTIRDAIAAILNEVNAREKQWLADVQPHLAKIAGVDLKAYQSDPTRWGLAVEMIEPTMRLNALYVYFITDQRRGTFRQLFQSQILKQRTLTGEFSRADLTGDLSSLVEAVEVTEGDDPRRQIANTSKETAAKLVQSSFKSIVDLAQEHWDERCRAMPRYAGGDSWGHLHRWIDPDGQVAKLAAALRTAWPNWGLEASLRRPGTEHAATEAWKRVDVLRQRYGPFTEHYGELVTTLTALALRSEWRPPAQLDRVGQQLGGASGRAVWDPGPILDTIGTDVVSTLIGKDLVTAVRDAENDVCQKIASYFDGRWDRVRGDLQSALADQDKVKAAQAKKEFDALATEVMELFGPNLSEVPGGRLRVLTDFRSARDTLRSATNFQKAVTQGFTVTFKCLRVPYKDSDVQGVKLPVVELEYKETTGNEPQRKTWTTGGAGADAFTVNWAPGKGSECTLRMWDENHQRSSIFHAWRGTNALIDAIREGGGLGGTMTWKGNGDFAGAEPGVFQIECSDSELLGKLLRADAPEPGGDLRPDCVEVLDRR